MVTNFEEITYELTEEELRIVPDMCEAFRRYSKDNPIKAPEICEKINSAEPKMFKAKFTEARLRKIVNYIRSNGMIPLIATSQGYYVDYSPEVLEAQIKSLKERGNSIFRCADGLQIILSEIRNPQKKLL